LRHKESKCTPQTWASAKGASACSDRRASATAGLDDQATSLTAVEANRALRPSSTPGQLESWAGRRTSRRREPLPWHLARATVDELWSPVDASAFCPGGLNRSAVGKTAISARGQPQPLDRPARTSLVACPSALRGAILGHGDARGRLRSLPALHGRPAPFPAHAPYPSIQSSLKPRPCQSRLRPPPLYPQGWRGLG
jgi:hypothetical protein